MTTETIRLSNDPGTILPILEREFSDFETESNRFLAGDIEENVFIGFRLKQGVYGQRQPGVNMLRVKLPLGCVTADQMDAFAEIAEHYAPLRKGHLTTRENYQFHHIPLKRMQEVLRILGKAGLSSREACGNTVRNVTGDPWAGVCEGELFDPTPYGAAFARWWLRNPLSQLLPRKFKAAFTATDDDRAITGIHDLGFFPRIQDGVKGFCMVTGGGLSILPRNAMVLREFVPVSEYLKVSEAVVRLFEKASELRKNRSKARLKFFIDRIGIEEFRRLVDAEIETNEDGWADKDFSPDRLLYFDDEAATAPAKKDSYQSPNGDMRAFTAFLATNVKAQRQQGFSTVEIKVTRGDMNPEQFRGVANIMREYAGGRARAHLKQNLVLRWVRDESIYEVWKKLGELDLADAGAGTITDVLSCPGTDSCKMGITSSMGLNRAIQEKLELMDIKDPLTSKVHINMSGCPNSCGQHHIANIGFHGAAMKVDGHQLPAYHVFMGGNYEGGPMRIGSQLKVRLPAKKTPEAVERWLKVYESNRSNGEEFNATFDRIGQKAYEDAVADLTIPGEFSDDNQSTFMDWGKLDLYLLQRGEGECAI